MSYGYYSKGKNLQQLAAGQDQYIDFYIKRYKLHVEWIPSTQRAVLLFCTVLFKINALKERSTVLSEALIFEVNF